MNRHQWQANTGAVNLHKYSNHPTALSSSALPSSAYPQPSTFLPPLIDPGHSQQDIIYVPVALNAVREIVDDRSFRQSFPDHQGQIRDYHPHQVQQFRSGNHHYSPSFRQPDLYSQSQGQQMSQYMQHIPPHCREGTSGLPYLQSQHSERRQLRPEPDTMGTNRVKAKVPVSSYQCLTIGMGPSEEEDLISFDEGLPAWQLHQTQVQNERQELSDAQYKHQQTSKHGPSDVPKARVVSETQALPQLATTLPTRQKTAYSDIRSSVPARTFNASAITDTAPKSHGSQHLTDYADLRSNPFEQLRERLTQTTGESQKQKSIASQHVPPMQQGYSHLAPRRPRNQRKPRHRPMEITYYHYDSSGQSYATPRMTPPNEMQHAQSYEAWRQQHHPRVGRNSALDRTDLFEVNHRLLARPTIELSASPARPAWLVDHHTSAKNFSRGRPKQSKIITASSLESESSSAGISSKPPSQHGVQPPSTLYQGSSMADIAAKLQANKVGQSTSTQQPEVRQPTQQQRRNARRNIKRRANAKTKSNKEDQLLKTYKGAKVKDRNSVKQQRSSDKAIAYTRTSPIDEQPQHTNLKAARFTESSDKSPKTIKTSELPPQQALAPTEATTISKSLRTGDQPRKRTIRHAIYTMGIGEKSETLAEKKSVDAASSSIKSFINDTAPDTTSSASTSLYSPDPSPPKSKVSTIPDAGMTVKELSASKALKPQSEPDSVVLNRLIGIAAIRALSLDELRSLKEFTARLLSPDAPPVVATGSEKVISIGGDCDESSGKRDGLQTNEEVDDNAGQMVVQEHDESAARLTPSQRLLAYCKGGLKDRVSVTGSGSDETGSGIKDASEQSDETAAGVIPAVLQTEQAG